MGATALLREGEVAVEACHTAVKETEEAALAAAELQTKSASACAQAEEALMQGKREVVSARAHVCAYGADMRRAKLSLDKRTKQLSAFRSGPLAAFEAMRSDMTGDSKGKNQGIESDELGRTSDFAGTSNVCDGVSKTV